MKIKLIAVEVNELRISHGELGFVLTCPADMQKDFALRSLMNVAGSDEFTFTVDITEDIPDHRKKENR